MSTASPAASARGAAAALSPPPVGNKQLVGALFVTAIATTALVLGLLSLGNTTLPSNVASGFALGGGIVALALISYMRWKAKERATGREYVLNAMITTVALAILAVGVISMIKTTTFNPLLDKAPAIAATAIGAAGLLVLARVLAHFRRKSEPVHPEQPSGAAQSSGPAGAISAPAPVDQSRTIADLRGHMQTLLAEHQTQLNEAHAAAERAINAQRSAHEQALASLRAQMNSEVSGAVQQTKRESQIVIDGLRAEILQLQRQLQERPPKMRGGGALAPVPELSKRPGAAAADAVKGSTGASSSGDHSDHMQRLTSGQDVASGVSGETLQVQTQQVPPIAAVAQAEGPVAEAV